MIKAYSVIKDLSPEAINILKKANITLKINQGESIPNQEELKKLIEQYDILMIGIEHNITVDMLEGIEKNKIIATISIGLDHIHPDVLNYPNMTVINCPTANVVSVAEHVFSLLLALQKRIIEANTIAIQGGNRKQLSQRSKEIRNATLGLIGAGKIAREVILMAKAFQMKIYCYTLHPNHHLDLLQEGVTFVDLDTLLSISDILSIHIPLTLESENLISKEKIALLKDHVTFINTSRAEIVDNLELMKKADQNENFLVGLDIDIKKDQEAICRPRKNVILTPHIAGVTEQSIKRMDIEVAENIITYLQKRENRKGEDC